MDNARRQTEEARPMQQRQVTTPQGSGGRKRVANACDRCRQQKIRCSGLMPCEQCTRRNLYCGFGSRSQKVLVTREFLDSLEQRANANARNNSLRYTDENTSVEDNIHDSERGRSNSLLVPRTEDLAVTGNSHLHPASTHASPGVQITNPFSNQYVADVTGRPWYLGTSSNWAFVRRVLNMAEERITGQPLPTHSTPFDGTMYDLGWDGLRDYSEAGGNLLPSIDYAVYLINAVKFHCGQLFHLFDETSFMQKFHDFHTSPNDGLKAKGLWYVHFLLVLAFGKAFVARGNVTRTPSGANLFVQAIKLMPDITFMCTQPLQAAEVYCSAALYLHCLDYRCAAYSMVGQALRIALEQGMHTNMQDSSLDLDYVQRCRKIWWTIYILDRHMSSFMGVPLSIRDEDISASLPTCSGSPQEAMALELNVKLSRIVSQILKTVYGTDGRLDRKFLSITRFALQNIAGVTDDLKRSFVLPAPGEPMAGVSRLSAYLHLLHHQCVVLATRPLLFSIFKMWLDHPEKIPDIISSPGSARTLLLMCIESSQSILSLLDGLRTQDLLETFLPFDLEAASAASIVVLLVPVLDPSLIEVHTTWLDTSKDILDDMLSRGNLQAGARKSELQQLQQVFSRMTNPSLDRQPAGGVTGLRRISTQGRDNNMQLNAMVDHAYTNTSHHHLNHNFLDESTWENELTANHLLMVADNLNLDGLEWMTTGSSGLPDQVGAQMTVCGIQATKPTENEMTEVQKQTTTEHM